MTAQCPCGKPSPDAFLCRPCTDALRRDLRDVAEVLRELTTEATRQAVGPRTEGGHGKAGSRMPLDADAMEAARGLRDSCWGWVRVAHEEIGRDLPLIADPAAWLVQNVDSVRAREWAGELAREMAERLDVGRRLMDKHRALRVLCLCGTWVTVSTTATMTCSGCHALGSLDMWRQWLTSEHTGPRTADQCYSALLVEGHDLGLGYRDRIRQWVARGKIEPVGKDSKGRSLFDVRVMVELMERRAA